LKTGKDFLFWSVVKVFTKAENKKAETQRKDLIALGHHLGINDVNPAILTIKKTSW